MSQATFLEIFKNILKTNFPIMYFYKSYTMAYKYDFAIEHCSRLNLFNVNLRIVAIMLSDLKEALTPKLSQPNPNLNHNLNPNTKKSWVRHGNH